MFDFGESVLYVFFNQHYFLKTQANMFCILFLLRYGEEALLAPDGFYPHSCKEESEVSMCE